VPEALAVTSRPSESLALQWLALALTPRLGPTRARRLVEHFGGVQNVFRASLTELEATGIQSPSAQSLGTGRSMELAHDELGRTAAAGVSVVCLDDSSYPTQLRQIYDPPLVLHVRGNVGVIAQPGIAIVGTRHPTPYGLGMAERLSCDLATRGLVIFSGLARGVDAAGHRGADAGPGWSPDLRISHEHVRRATEFSHSQPHHQRYLYRCAGGGGCRIQWDAYYVALCPGTESRGLCRARKCDQREFLGTQHLDQAGCQADRHVGRRLGRTPCTGTTCVDSRHRR